ncbi:MAG: hypothetical protein EU530_06405 [Promethearchaeota archaeon]|nr:MAG: hypothetical protein EU530_06405 [Candidatus Lokiarchaeota archaeon]
MTDSRNRRCKTYFLWIGCLLIPILGLMIGIMGGGELDRQITAFIHNFFKSIPFLQTVGNLFQYSYFVFLGGTLVCSIIVILYLSPKTTNKVEVVSKYAIMYLLVMILSFLDHIILQLVVNRIPFAPEVSSLHPFYQVNPSFGGIWNSSFPNNNLILSGVIILFPVLFGNRSPIFKWIVGLISGILIITIALTEIGLSKAWFTDIFVSIGIVLFWAWIVYWHILFIKEEENTVLYKKLTELYYQAYQKVIDSKSAHDLGNLDECKQKLYQAKELYNQSISSIQNFSADVSNYLQRNEFWKFNVNLLINEIENNLPPSRKWLYIF